MNTGFSKSQAWTPLHWDFLSLFSYGCLCVCLVMSSSVRPHGL